MPRYLYRCRDAQGSLREGLLRAETAAEAAAQLRGRNWEILKLSGSDEAAAEASVDSSLRMSPHALTLFTSHLTTLLAAGVNIVQAISLAGNDQLSEQLADRILKGERLSHAMARFPATFSPIYVNLVRVGEETGALVTMLERLNANLQANEARRGRLWASLTYPAVVLVAVMLMVLYMIFFMAPQFSAMLAGMGVELPWMTRVLIALGDRHVWQALLGATLLGGVWLWGASRTPAGRLLLERLLYQAPMLGPLAQLGVLARLSHNLSLMLDVGLSWTRSLELLVSPTCGYERFDEGLVELRRQLEGGDFLEALGHCPVFPPLLRGLICAGFEARNVTRFLTCYAELADSQLELSIAALLNLLEPMLVLGLGLVVGLVVMAAFLPVYRLMFTL